MVSDSRQSASAFRQCPDLGDDTGESPLMQHLITLETCESRQDRGYHKCCRCVHQDVARALQRIGRVQVMHAHHELT